MTFRSNSLLLILAAATLSGLGCGRGTTPPQDSAPIPAPSTIRADGSSTVFPITEAAAEEFGSVRRDVRMTVGISGTGGGFKRFCAGETDIQDASRPIKPAEAELCASAGVEFIEIPIAYDGLSVVVNPKNTWVDHLTVAELKRIWEPGSTVTAWNDVRPGWPARPIRLFGPGTDSGTFDYFTESITGTARASRSDFQASEDDNTLVTGVAGELDGLGYFGFAYYSENAERLRLVPIDGGNGPVLPAPETIKNGTYTPLSRPLLIYARKSDRPELAEFMRFFLANAPMLATEVGFVPLSPELYAEASRRHAEVVTGSAYLAHGGGGHPSLDAVFLAGLP